MRTSNSPRNQNRLFNELFRPPTVPKPPERILTDEEIDAMPWPANPSTKAAEKRHQAAMRWRAAHLSDRYVIQSYPS